MSLEYVKLMTGVDNAQVAAIYDMVKNRLIYRLRELNVSAVPVALDYVLDEIAIARFNYIGSEGMTQESVEGHSATYTDDLFKIFDDDIQTYIDENLPDTGGRQKGVVYFL